jgi:hypothetical protein
VNTNPRHRWLVIVLVVALIDIGGRFAFGFNMARVIVFESVLFVAACVLMAVLAVKLPAKSARLGLVERWLGAAFGLAGIRTIVWASGAGVGVANVVVVGVGVILVLGLVINGLISKRRRSAPGEGSR